MTVSKSDESFFSSNSFLTLSMVSDGKISIRVLHVSFLIKVSWNAEMLIWKYFKYNQMLGQKFFLETSRRMFEKY